MTRYRCLFALIVIFISYCSLGKVCQAAVEPQPGYAIEFFAALENSLSYQAFIGEFAVDGRLLCPSRDAVGPTAPHNVLAVDLFGMDTVLRAYPNNPEQRNVIIAQTR